MITERSPEAKLAYHQGFQAGIEMAACKMDRTAALYKAYAENPRPNHTVEMMEQAFATCTEAAKNIRGIATTHKQLLESAKK